MASHNMRDNQVDNQALRQLQSNQGELLDDIDKLRSKGIGRYIELPQLIVCGDQSSGKSSVLEAISRVRFPTKENLCTRFATELILRRALTSSVSVTIEPGSSRSAEEKQRLREFKSQFSTADDFPSLIDEAKDIMGVDRGGSMGAFSDDVLRVEISGPSQPHLTIVDLPGLTHTAENPHDVSLVRGLVESYMANSRSIILAITTAKNDIENQIVLNLVEKHDPEGARTLGIITKPDTLHAGSGTEERFVKLAKNGIKHLRLGWHVLKNRDYNTKDASDSARDEAEKEFLSNGIWTNLPRGDVGIETLRIRLSKVLLDQISSNLPALVSQIESGVQECRERLDRLGDPRSTKRDQKKYLIGISMKFKGLVTAATEGEYSHDFFDEPESLDWWPKRLRAVIHDLNEQFAESMYSSGHRRRLIGSSIFARGDAESISRADLVAEIKEESRKSRGKELSGFPNALLVGKLFRDQSKPWERIANEHVKSVWNTVKAFLRVALEHLASENTYWAVSRELIDPWLEAKEESLQQMLGVLLKSLKRGHPITYDPSFAYERKILQIKQQGRQLREKLDGVKVDKTPEERKYTWQEVESAVLSDESVDSYGSSKIIDSLEEYYRIAIRTFIDNVAILVIENILIDSLPEIFPPELVNDMDDTLVERLAAESDDVRSDRKLLKEKSEVLSAGLKTCARFSDLGGRRRPSESKNNLSSSHYQHKGSRALTTATQTVSSSSVSTPSLNGKGPPSVKVSGPSISNSHISSVSPKDSIVNSDTKSRSAVQISESLAQGLPARPKSSSGAETSTSKDVQKDIFGVPVAQKPSLFFGRQESEREEKKRSVSASPSLTKPFASNANGATKSPFGIQGGFGTPSGVSASTSPTPNVAPTFGADYPRPFGSSQPSSFLSTSPNTSTFGATSGFGSVGSSLGSVGFGLGSDGGVYPKIDTQGVTSFGQPKQSPKGTPPK